MAKEHIDIIECPRDAMQGIKQFIPTEMKIRYINSLMSVGFHTIDFGSFVSPKAIPQMKDTSLVIDGIDTKYNTNLLAIVANKRGIDDALCHEKITHLGYPFSISEIFQNRNTNRSIEDSKFVLDYLINFYVHWAYTISSHPNTLLVGHLSGLSQEVHLEQALLNFEHQFLP